ncbi:unnamed protein product [Priceomyces carsonii]|nr:unnamed protein product [Priceomyces carsonii]
MNPYSFRTLMRLFDGWKTMY